MGLEWQDLSVIKKQLSRDRAHEVASARENLKTLYCVHAMHIREQILRPALGTLCLHSDVPYAFGRYLSLSLFFQTFFVKL